MSMIRLPAYFLSHGGGPWPYMKDELGGKFDQLEASIKDIPRQLGVKPKAVLVITAHWEEPVFTVSSGSWPSMIYDFSGFPEYTYHVKYPAPGSPELAERVRTLLETGGCPARLNPARGFDHGTFSMLEPLYPQADVPVVQLSLRSDFDPSAHINAGSLLAPLRDEGVLILGSGFSYHNLGRFDSGAAQPSRLFDAWLQETLTATSSEQRRQRLLTWENAPAARFAHPREDHLLPLMVAVGSALEEPGVCIYHQDDLFRHITASSFRFGNTGEI